MSDVETRCLCFFIFHKKEDWDMGEKLKLYGFNNLTKALSFNIYDVCYAKTAREQKEYIAYIDEEYNLSLIHISVEIFLSKANAPQEYETIEESELKEDDVVVEHIHEDAKTEEKENENGEKEVVETSPAKEMVKIHKRPVSLSDTKMCIRDRKKARCFWMEKTLPDSPEM